MALGPSPGMTCPCETLSSSRTIVRRCRPSAFLVKRTSIPGRKGKHADERGATFGPTLVKVPPRFIHGTAESRTYTVRPPTAGGRVTLSRDPSYPKPETTEIGVPHHGQGGEVDSPEQVAWFQATFGDCAGLRETWDGCWSIDDPALAAILETRLAAMADLIVRRLKTTDSALAPAIVGARPAAFRSETLDWTLRWFPGMKQAPLRYAEVHACTSREPTNITAYGVHYGPDTAAPGRPSEWFRALTGGGLGPGPTTHDAAGREVHVTRLDEDGLARLVAAMLALPGEAVEQSYAAWEMVSA